jgi:hypothetical protein
MGQVKLDEHESSSSERIGYQGNVPQSLNPLKP